ncbi:bifunctional methylenetetrahydrofolate dehydrogenase/methenyltetrahydrofolate cyclohydrolase FolD [Pumilibacter intestinalis]|uniref:bifunctional methylenetetrahydrofolate dehydrogenase/methenyltetrahydrofolate cyclohydrolase FolD n=1 Tax=Pumilibacter intestinalis TaxID=2941511 RepID=UPI00203BCC9D|nr:bifunctional methylenetetrahydrofolate dehydrogenase/methenyltetrahydrofolate cyclohydrolase FolD [Pumilibacter intestinalis]
MSAKIIDGKAIAERVRADVRKKAEAFAAKKGRRVGLAVILAGENPASKIYVRNKIKACEDAAIKSFSYELPAETPENKIIELVQALNEDKNIDGILVQLPLPEGVNEKRVLEHVAPHKDVDGFHAMNAGNLMLGNPCLAACTPQGCIELIRSAGVEIEGKNAVVVGRSNIVGKPMAMLLLQNNATVTVAHSRTQDLKSVTSRADILVAAVGIKEFITGDMIKSGAVVIDVGMNRHDGKLYGDVNFGEACEKASYITPVPGGVGPMTIAMLLSNTVAAAEKNA